MLMHAEAAGGLQPIPFKNITLPPTGDVLAGDVFATYEHALVFIDTHGREMIGSNGQDCNPNHNPELVFDFAEAWVRYAEHEAVRRQLGRRSLLPAMEQQTIRTAAKLCLPETVDAMFMRVATYPREKGVKTRVAIDADPTTWRLVTDQISLGSGMYPEAGLLSDTQRVPLVSRGYLRESYERCTTSRTALRLQADAAEAVRRYANRRYERGYGLHQKPVYTVLAELALARSYGELDVAHDDYDWLRAARLDAAIEKVGHMGISLDFIRTQIPPEDEAHLLTTLAEFSRVPHIRRRKS